VERPLLKPLPVLVLVWAMAGIGAVAGSILGNALGRTGLYAGAIIGGACTASLAILLATRLSWLPRAVQGRATVGALVGLCLAAPIAVANLHTPITPVAVTSLAGVGALLGAGWGGRTDRR
jgi:hypothetical protein